MPGQPERIGQYRVVKSLERGGMGEVYLAQAGRPLEGGSSVRDVLLKLAAPEVLGNAAAVERFEREGAALARLDHPGVQRLLESGRQGDRAFHAVEFLPGETLRDVLRRRGRLPADEARRICGALAGALAYCHAQGVVHRDLKPENVVLAEPDQRPVLIDFGSVLLEGARRVTFAGISGSLGSPEYMAPEQVRGERGDARSDVYALGMVLYELLVGAPPFAAGEGEGPLDVMRKHLEDGPPPPPAGVADLAGEALLGVIARAIARRPEDRFQSAVELRDALADPEAALARGAVLPVWPAVALREGSARERNVYLLAALAVLAALFACGAAAAWLLPGFR